MKHWVGTFGESSCIKKYSYEETPKSIYKNCGKQSGKRIVKAYLVVAPRNPPKERNTMESTKCGGIFFEERVEEFIYKKWNTLVH